MATKLFIGTYQYSVKKYNSRQTTATSNNDFLSNAYDIDGNYFTEGFVKDFVEYLDAVVYKDKGNTRGAKLKNHAISGTQRTFDIMVDGGMTGIKQMIIDSLGNKKDDVSKDDIIAMSFFARIWMPAGSSSCFIFHQKYGNFSLKPIFDGIINDLLKKKGYSMILGKSIPTTTLKRAQEFMKIAVLDSISIISKKSFHDTGIDVSSAVLKIKVKNGKKITDDEVRKIAKKSGFNILGEDYEVKGTFIHEKFNEQKTTVLDSEENFNIVPNFRVPNDCIDENNYPIFKKMRDLLNEEIKQIEQEAAK